MVQLADVSQKLSREIYSIVQRDRKEAFRSEPGESELIAIIERLELDLREKSLHRMADDPDAPTGKETITWVRARRGSYRILEELANEHADRVEAAVCWMLCVEDLKWWGADCYRLIPGKTDRMFDAALLEPDPSYNRQYIEPCIKHKSALEVYHRIRDSILDEGLSDTKRAGALRAIYWTGVAGWPSLAECDEYRANREAKTNREWGIHLGLLKEYKVIDMDAAQIKEHRESHIKSMHERFARRPRADIEKAERAYADIANACIELFLDRCRSIALRKEAYVGRPSWERLHVLSEHNRSRMEESDSEAALFPDGFIQSSISSKTKPGEIPLLHSVTTPLTLNHRLAILWRKLSRRVLGFLPTHAKKG